MAVSISVMLFALIVLLLSWAEGYPSEDRARNYQDLSKTSGHLQRSGNIERLDPEYNPEKTENDRPVIEIRPINRFGEPTDDSGEGGVSVISLNDMLHAMRRRFQTVFNHMRSMMGSAEDLPAPNANSNDTEIVRKISIDGQDFVQTRQVLRKPLPEGQGMIVVVRQQLIPVDEFYGNGTTTMASPTTTSNSIEANTIVDADP